jgi:molybdopterin-guanine dinucleotide biosynthesis protein A
VTGRPPITGAILAGGRSSRLGTNKALVTLGGRPIIRRVLSALTTALPEVMIIAADPVAYADLGVPVLPDRVAGAGPLGGLYTALIESRLPHVFCIACDMPFAHPAVIAALAARAAEADVVVPESADGLEPLHAVYAQGCLPALAALLASGERRVAALFELERVRVCRVPAAALLALDPSGRAFDNVNTPEELGRARAHLAAAEGEPCAS